MTDLSAVALIVNLKTSSHLDNSDSRRYHACISTYGRYTGGQLVLPDFDLALAMPPASVCFLLGTQITHYVAGWQGKERYSMTCFFKEVVLRESLRRGCPPLATTLPSCVAR